MKFKEYYKTTKDTTNSCIKICGVIFTSIYVIIAIGTGYKNQSIIDSLEIFVLCFVLGNAFGLFIWLLAITASYSQTKNTIRNFNSIPENIQKEFGFKLFVKPQNPKYNYMELDIICVDKENPISLDFEKKFVSITLRTDLRNVDNFQKRFMEIGKKYKKQRISLTGFGLRKSIKRKDWNEITQSGVYNIIDNLKEVSKDEGV